MGQRSSIESDPRVREAVDQAIAGGATIDAIVAAVRAIGGDVSRSAVGRYSKKYADLARRQRDMAAMSAAFAGEFGSTENQQGRLLVQLTTNVLTRAAMEFDDEEGGGLDTKEMSEFARATLAVTQAAKIDVEREARIREEEAKRVKAAAAAAAEEVTRASGASEETIRTVRARILGIAA